MKFLSYELTRKLLENGKPENRDQDHPPVVKLFLPNTPCTWLLSEINYQEPNLAFGLCDLGLHCPEIGYVSLTELATITSPILNLPVECDRYFTGQYPLSIYAEAAKLCAGITEDKIMLARIASKYNL